jgi:hypothetical protein
MSGPSNMRNFTENSYNLEAPGNSWCVTPGSIYTNPNARFNYFNKNLRILSILLCNNIKSLNFILLKIHALI